MPADNEKDKVPIPILLLPSSPRRMLPVENCYIRCTL